MKFGVGVLYKKTVEKDEFRENKLRENHILLKSINEFLPTLCTLLQHFERN
jgi:hypothetical protein